jgi:hypothetical protein
MNINYELIGSIPAMEPFRDTLPELIAEYEAEAPKRAAARAEIQAAYDNGGPSAVEALLQAKFNNVDAGTSLTRGVTIELCAQHFYGIDTYDCDSIADTIAQIRAIEQELQFGK